MLETERLSLFPWEDRHWTELQPLATDPEVMRYITGKPWPEERIREFASRQVRWFRERGFCMWRAVEKASGGMIGFCGIQPLPETEEIEIGWWLGRLHWGKGLATEAAREVLRDAFGRVGLERVVAIAQPANRRSRRVMEKLGMRYESTRRHRGVEVVVYAIARSAGRQGGAAAT